MSTVNAPPGHPYKVSDECLLCHDVNSGESSTIALPIPYNAACVDCHTETSRFTTSGPHEYIDCIDCHTPHQSQYVNLLVKQPINLCMESCHGVDQLGQSHPIGPGVIDVNTGREMTCTSTCHQIHNPNAAQFLSATDSPVCYSCHSKKF